MLNNTEFDEQVRNKPLALSSQTVLSPEFKLGEGWVRMQLLVKLILVAGTAAGAVPEGELQIIKAISLRTDKGEILVNNIPGRLMYRLAEIKQGAAGVKDAIAAASGTYVVPIDIWFADRRLAPEERNETLLDTSRYSSLQFSLSMGSLSDLFTAPGTATLTATLDISVERFRGALPADMKPEGYVQYGFFPPQAPSAQQFQDLEKSENLAYKRLQIHTTSGAIAGTPASGAADNTVINDLDVEGSERFTIQNMLADSLRRRNQVDFNLPSIAAGVMTESWVDKSESLTTVLKSGGQSRLRVNWRNNPAGLPAGAQVTIAYEAIRPLTGIV